MTRVDNNRTIAVADRSSLVGLVQVAGRLLPRQLNDEVSLAVAELKAKGVKVGVAAGLLAGALLLLASMAISLLVAAILGLGEAIAPWLSALLFAAFFLPQTSHAAIGALDDTPGSSLLFPYFEVDLDHPTGRDTVLTVQNASATAMLAHTIVWSDEGVASAIFDIYLTGYDIMSFSMRDVLDGSLPLTGSDGQDPTDTISPQGPFSQDINFASCSTFLPYAPGTIPAPASRASRERTRRSSWLAALRVNVRPSTSPGVA